MMFAVTSSEMKEIDRVSIVDHKIPADILMYTAGFEVFKYIKNYISSNKIVQVLSGKGNNGGDGFVIAFLLNDYGINTKVYFKDTTEKLTPEALKYYNMCLERKIITEDICEEADVFIDCLLGTGICGEIHGVYADIAKRINSLKKIVYSVDIPSGLPSEGIVKQSDSLIKADETFTIGLVKRNMIVSPGKYYCGKVTVLDNIFPMTAKRKNSLLWIPEKYEILKLANFYKENNTYKYKEGNFLIYAGSKGMEGAAILASESLFSAGCGIQVLITDSESRSVIAGKIPELMVVDFNEVIINKNNYDCMICGPGIGRSQKSYDNIVKIMNLSREDIPIIIDGDALYFIAKFNLLNNRKNVILTPHDGEAALLLNISVEEVRFDRINVAKKISNDYNSVVVLKGSENIICYKDSICVISNGNESLATAGSGDVLTGIICSLIKRTDSLVDACICGVYIQGEAADLAIKSRKYKFIKSGDIIKYFPEVIDEF